MDYQCPPCKRTQDKLKEVMQRYDGKLRLAVRHLPLEMHKYAFPAAVAAESAREQGRFWNVHAALFTEGTLDTNRINAVARTQGLEMTRFKRSSASTAKDAVNADLKLAGALNVRSTPSLLLCCPDGRVVQIYSLSQLAGFIQ